MKVSELGEFGLIERLAELLASQGSVPFSDHLVVGIGDDAAVWKAGGRAIIATTDTLVEGVHFLPDKSPWRDLGWKALAVNVSDIAAMGGQSEFALVTLALTADTQTEQIDDLYLGLSSAAGAYGVVIAGGDIVRSPTFAITVALLGRGRLDQSGEPLVLRRAAAAEGDLIAVTGSLGGAAGGLRLLRDGGPASEVARTLIDRHLRPQARAQAGPEALAAGIRCAIDVSDGLVQDLGQVCKASRVGAVVWRDKLPLEPALAELFGAEEALRMAATGGEDYELLVVGTREQIERLRRRAGVPVTVIGETVIDARCEAKLLDESGRAIEITAAGWDHLKGHG